MSDKIIVADRFAPEHRDTLAALLDTMIPANAEFGAPSGGDEEILNDVLASMTGNAADTVIELLGKLQKLTSEPFAAQAPATRWTIFEKLQQDEPHSIRLLGGLALQCYYRNGRTLESLGMEARSPFPLGQEVEQGDWTLLDPVKARGKIYREV